MMTFKIRRILAALLSLIVFGAAAPAMAHHTGEDEGGDEIAHHTDDDGEAEVDARLAHHTDDDGEVEAA
ncbi:hypothetical protein DV096_04260 [Bradymonadaceae bacterium TMQ3]|uniref:Uncharacterized protein n=1 Tax=Lujinxingia sediminis TaxID=2480984 RepID=A0ABY0CXK6_9DELT|nr:hypothetical protein [Lujinxingia sediminis]RDV39786.1 hypothetical protein DV096_04260 [Bradymonadaceae bacterium TMQ3]RVU48170.1 hypothetical protein EA187_01665 [Lujinxingia sediminis]TXC77470.1 hypothetical protein FRC91_01675 [Bradymonadales bacterium TMQ1]